MADVMGLKSRKDGFGIQPGPPPSLQGISDLGLNPQETHLYLQHLQNLRNSPLINPDGSVSTLRQITIEQNGKTYSIPTIWEGQELDYTEALQRALQKPGGIDYWPSYPSEAEAQQRYDAMHQFLDLDSVK